MINLKTKYFLAADQMLFSGMSFLLTICVSRIFDIVTFGLFASLIIGLYLILSISQAIIIQPMQINLAKVKNTALYRGFLLKCLGVFILFLMLISVAFYGLDIRVVVEFKEHIPAFVCYVSAFVVHDFFRKYFLCTERVQDVLIIDLSSVICQILLLIYLFFVDRGTLNTLLYGLALTYVPALILSFLKYPFFFWVGPQKVFLMYHYTKGRWLFFTSITQWVSNNLFIIFSGLFVGITALAALRLGQTIFGILNIILQTIENYLIPYINRLYQSSTQEGIRFLRKLSKNGFLIMLIFSLPFFFFSKTIMLCIGGSEYVAFHYVLKGLCLLYVVIFTAYPVRISIRILELNKSFFIGYLMALMVSIIYFQFLLIHYELYGAIAGLVFNQIIMLAVCQYALNRKKFYLWKLYT